MFALCTVIALVLCYAVDRAFSNTYVTFGLAALMGLSSGFFCAVDQRRQEGNGKA